MGFREDLNQNRGATPEAINALGTYKFKSKKARGGEGNDSGGGVLAAGTDKERAVSAEDAVRFSPRPIIIIILLYNHICNVKLIRAFWLAGLLYLFGKVCGQR
jgi:hypothetical protein